MPNNTQPADAVEVMVLAYLSVDKMGLNINCADWKENYRIGMRAALAADPLRQLLGPEAVKAILEGQAAVVPLEWGKGYALQSAKYTNGAISDVVILKRVRLDQPANPTVAKNATAAATLSKSETVQPANHIGDANKMVPAKGDAHG